MKQLTGLARLSIFGAVFTVSLIVLGGKALAFSGSGAGTGSGDPYHITNCDQFAEMSLAPSSYYVLDDDIDCSGHADFTGAVVLGSFTGTLDGQNHQITGLTIDAPTQDNTGLFDTLHTATIKNLSINADVTGKRNVGILAGEMNTGTSVDKVMIFGTLHCTNENCGGITGNLRDNSTITNSGVLITLTDDGQSAGGLVGWVSHNGTISTSYASGTISGTNYVGGLVGAVNTISGVATITNTYSDATVTGSEWVGGLVGVGSELNLYASYASGSVTGIDSVGGLVGLFFGDMAEDFSAAEVHGTGGAVGPVTGHFAGGTVGNRYFDTARTGFSSSPDGSSPIDTDSDPDYFLDNHTNPPVSTWTFNATHWRTNFKNYPSFAPLFDPMMLCEAPSSTNTTIHGVCGLIPLGWGTATWDVRWSVHGKNNWHSVNLDDVRFPETTVSGLTPGTEYDLQFRFTNDFGTGPWGTVEILTTGTAPAATTTKETTVAQTTGSDYTAPADSEDDTTVTTTSTPVTDNTIPAATTTVAKTTGHSNYLWFGIVVALAASIGLFRSAFLYFKP